MSAYRDLSTYNNFQKKIIVSDILNPVQQDVAVKESSLLNDTEYELHPLEDEDDSDTDIGWT
jgi:hypothetical protein